jgi:hypothetical protein
MISFTYTVSDPRTVMVVVLFKSYFHTTVAVVTMTSFRRFFTFTEGTNELSLKSLIQKKHGFLIFMLDVPRVTVTDHHERDHADHKDNQRSHFKWKVKMRHNVQKHQHIPENKKNHVNREQTIRVLHRLYRVLERVDP